ncbi:MAG: hypothetical protein APG08_00475 [Candidatus Methanofastidiosum methylothiophilum]|uniref:Uncharacterized protein n=1 Tax=Candidatus Methanofastidiosum methylothiophilum TaxID=1705564 RepID=A0A150JL89_9EURY|nr:MAG: hypothetical protein APG08_00475 [Candidatus Methanofastidiosum methylthiophilus]KYC57947.1 MAG: hypothetical protein APG09_00834 [Candidatus Methanofastidiosum methylthiophilus]
MNNKGQFFIFAAVLVILSFLVIQYSLLSHQEVSQTISDIPFSDIPFISNYIESSVRDTSKNAFEEVYRTGNLDSMHQAFSEIYSAHYEIEERELNYYLSNLDIGIQNLRATNVDFDKNILITGPSTFEVGNFNRKLLANIVKTGANKYQMHSDIGLFIVEPLDGALPPSSLNPFVLKIDFNKNNIFENNEILYRDNNYTSQSRLIYKDRLYTISESKITYGGMHNIENWAPFLETYYLVMGADAKGNYIEIKYQNGNNVVLDGISRFYVGDVFLLDAHLIKITDISYMPNGRMDEYVKYIILNVQISLQETERRREWFDPNENPGLRYGLIEIIAQKENGIKTSTITTNDRVVVSSLIHNDLEGNISDKDILGIKKLGSSLKIWEIVNVILYNNEGIFFSESSQYKVNVNTTNEKINAIYAWNGSQYILIDVNTCYRDPLGKLYCKSAYPLVEGDSFNLIGEEYIVKDITTTSVSFLRKNTGLIDVVIDKDEDGNPSQAYKYEYGQFKLGGRNFRIYIKKNSGNVEPYSVILDPETSGENINLLIGDPFVLNKDPLFKEDYGLVFEGMDYFNKDEKWHVFLRYFDMASDKGKFPLGKTRLLFGWDNNYKVVDTWTYNFNSDGNITIIHKDLSLEKTVNKVCLTKNGILSFFPYYTDNIFEEFDLYYPANGDQIYLGEQLAKFEIDVFNQYVRILVDADRDGDLSNNNEYIHQMEGNSTFLKPGDIFFSEGVGFQIVSIIPYHDGKSDKINRALIKRVPYYQYLPILNRINRTGINEFTSILSNHKFYIRRPGDYLIAYSYSFEIDGIKKETSQYYNFKVHQ